MPDVMIPCVDCYTYLLRESVDAAVTWWALAEHLDGDSPYIGIQRPDIRCPIDELEEDFRILEESGYIVTHELPRYIWIVRFNGIAPGSQLICVENHIDE